MGRWLAKLENMPERHPTKLTEPPFVSFVSSLSSHSAKNNIDKTQKITSLRKLIVHLKQIYGGSDSVWSEFADDVVHDWSHDLDAAIACFHLVY